MFRIVLKLSIHKKIFYYSSVGILIMCILYFNYFETVNRILSIALFEKASSASFDYRTSADLFTFNILADTYLLGAGLGSNRPSSFLAYILSNVGIVGFILFVSIGLKSVWAYIKYRSFDQFLDITFAGILGCLMVKSIAGPDLSTAYLWVFFGAFIANLNLAGKNYPASDHEIRYRVKRISNVEVKQSS